MDKITGKAFAMCHEGFEDMTAKEIMQTIGKEAEQKKQYVIFPFSKKEEVLKLAYLGKTIRKTGIFLKESRYSSVLSDLEKAFKRIDFSAWIGSDFMIRCEKARDLDFSSKEIEEEAGGWILESNKAKVNLENPETSVLVFIDKDRFMIGIDLSKTDLSKRPYRLFTSAAALKASIASSMNIMAGIKKGMRCVDPFCMDGTIPIEGALYINNRSAHEYTKEMLGFETAYFFKGVNTSEIMEEIDKKATGEKTGFVGFAQKLPYLSYAKKNAKIAEVQKSIELSKVDVEWLDTKFDKESVDRLITRVPEIGKHANISDIERAYKEFFYQADYVLNKKGKIIIISQKDELLKKWASHYSFSMIEEREVLQGKMLLKVMVFVKKGIDPPKHI